MKKPKRDIFQTFLSDRRLQFTLQRSNVLDAFLSVGTHVSTEELFLHLRASFPGIAYSTVFRTLKLLVESGLAREINIGDGQARYEVVDGDIHDHLVCTRCKTIFDFESHQITRLRNEIAATYHFFIESHKFELYGLCSACRSLS